MKNWKMALKMVFGFGIVLVLLAVIAIMSVTGIAGIIDNAKTVIEGNKLNGLLTQREVDHLNWAGEVNGLLTDDSITELNVEVDDHECLLGKWLYGDGRKDAELLVPSLAPLFTSIEEPHRLMHESATHIKDVFVQADLNIPAVLARTEIDHLKWASTIRDSLLANAEYLTVETDHEKCGLGIWLQTDTAVSMYNNGSSEFKSIWDDLKMRF